MADSFEVDVLPVVKKLADKALWDPDLRDTAIVLAWYYWANRPRDLPPSVSARCGVRAARAGRDLPGVQSPFKDAWDRLTKWNGAGMQNVMDQRPGPDRQAEVRELFTMFMDDLNDSKRELAESFMDGMRAGEVARGMDRSPARITQMRQELAKEWAEM